MRIAIDGPSGAGKSSVAKAVAGRLGALYLDTGAMYRALGLYALERGADTGDSRAIIKLMDEAKIDVAHASNGQRMYLNGRDVTGEIRTGEVSRAASDVSKIARVREKMVERQREIAAGRDVVMDGRDIGTVVLPDAEVKIFLTATPQERARRRFMESGGESLEAVLQAIIARDEADATRAASPLKKAFDAWEIDSTSLTVEEVANKIISLAEGRL